MIESVLESFELRVGEGSELGCFRGLERFEKVRDVVAEEAKRFACTQRRTWPFLPDATR